VRAEHLRRNESSVCAVRRVEVLQCNVRMRHAAPGPSAVLTPRSKRRTVPSAAAGIARKNEQKLVSPAWSACSQQRVSRSSLRVLVAGIWPCACEGKQAHTRADMPRCSQPARLRG
jgi:hypothetical protein